MSRRVIAYDSTLRDGAQAQGVSFSVEDKLKIVQRLDELGIGYVEAGNPGSNPKDLEFFTRVGELNLRHAKIIAFGSTRRIGITAAEDKNLQSLLSANTQAVAIFGKSWDYQVTDILRTSLQENLAMIGDTIAYLKAQGKEVVFDAEHFYDGYKANAEYALQTLQAAADAGADVLVLCDTNGGTFPDEIFAITKTVVARYPLLQIGIHCHNDCDMAVANSVAAIQAGAVQVQGTMNGIGERCGNANLVSIIPNVQLKLGFECISGAQLAELTAAARFVSEVANVAFNDKAPYVGYDAFSHKGGMHIDAVNKNPKSYEHISPNAVGNERHILVSEVAGRGAILSKLQQIDPTLTKESEAAIKILEHLKALEHEGYQFESAESSFELLMQKLLGKFQPFFTLKQYSVDIHEPSADGMNSSVTVHLIVEGQESGGSAQADGPVDALDQAMRNALAPFYPAIQDIKLVDYKVRVLDSNLATAAKVRVMIESTDQQTNWTTIGVSTDIIQASWLALKDAVEYKLLNAGKTRVVA
ncbi:2-isopropylmalate synthase [Methylophilus rhizosphaerae]|uniref:Citramalate synthase n=1 Tax=Methylophilus rhizosphaerae TaxID=492660 RepID=A0A1G8Z6G9_9PROT|nr:citramalate synthase [Methylophilus rhizosphaerae]SDK09800.1 2-isopropylmalate synthase [Methylophilus rhizosphaerae]